MVWQQNDMLQWILDEGTARNHSDMDIVKRIFLVNFAAIHTSSGVSPPVHAPNCVVLTSLHNGVPDHHTCPV